jgi:ferritin
MDINMQALQDQLTLERTNAAYYRSMADALEAVNWAGSAAWMRKASNDEQGHADRVAAYIVDRNGQPVYGQIDEIPELSGDDLFQYFQAALAREKDTTASIVALYVSADVQTQAFLMAPGDDWPGFIAEQTQSEREIVDILQELGRLDKSGWKLVDQELGKK